jgi:hypothetical protein
LENILVTIEAYPLYWPPGRQRTSTSSREPARFDSSFARARDEVIRQVEMLCGKYSWQRKEANIIISTNLQLRRDGIPLAGQPQPDDVGVAVYFTYKKQQVCFACDRWRKIEDNMQAIAKTIDALRGVARWGTGDMMEAAFKGFTALAGPAAAEWWDVLEVRSDSSRDAVNANYRRLRSQHHPDRGGDAEKFQRIQRAFEQFEAMQS